MKLNVADVLFRDLNGADNVNDICHDGSIELKQVDYYKGIDCFILDSDNNADGSTNQYILNSKLLDPVYVHQRYKRTCRELVRESYFFAFLLCLVNL